MATETEVTDQAILEALHRVPREKWGLVLEILHNLEPHEVDLPPHGADPGCWTARQLRALPRAERNAIIEAQVLLAVDLYPIGLDDDYSDYVETKDSPTG
jgi:hypothetical protein